MRVSREVAEENRKRVIASAGQLFRVHGFEGIGIADLMKSVGLTQGGFYKQFESKEDLARAACEQAMTENLSLWREKLEGKNQGSDLLSFIRAYLSPTHREQPERGCLLAALAPEAARHEGPVRRVFAQAIETYASFLSPLMQGHNETENRAAALAMVSQIVGALALARVVPDQKLAGEILEASIHSISARASPATKGETEH